MISEMKLSKLDLKSAVEHWLREVALRPEYADGVEIAEIEEIDRGYDYCQYKVTFRERPIPVPVPAVPAMPYLPPTVTEDGKEIPF